MIVLPEILDHERDALAFLKDHGPHTIGPIDSDAKFCAAATFTRLAEIGLVGLTDFGGGYVQMFASPAGLALLDGEAA